MTTLAYGDIRASIHNARGEMKTSAVRIVLSPADVLSLKTVKQGTKIQCESGKLWLTQEGDPVDYFLMAGKAFEPKGSGLLVLQAMEESSVRVSS